LKKNRYPQVLLLGNGLNRAFGGVSWDELLDKISVRNDIKAENLSAPEPLRAITVTNNNIDVAMKTHKVDLFGKIQTVEQWEILDRILSMGFDCILTTNFSYELESAAMGVASLTESQVKKLQKHSDDVERADNQYLIHTYNEVVSVSDKQVNRIWHIHGEARKTNSTILGHYYYGNLLFKIRDYCNDNCNKKCVVNMKDGKFNINSWIDAFILGDVYILGFGFGLSEFDLWWLLNRRKRKRNNSGDMFFYEPEHVIFNEKADLLSIFDVESVHCGMKKQINDKGKEHFPGDYREFYKAALDDIEMKMKESR